MFIVLPTLHIYFQTGVKICPNATGIFEPSAIIQSGVKDVKEILNAHDIYLAALTSHCNLIYDDVEKRENARDTLIQAIEATHILGVSVFWW